MYIGLIPEHPVFNDEHLTLCWLGHEVDPDDARLAEIIARKVSHWLFVDRPTFFIAHRQIFRDGAIAGIVRSTHPAAMGPLYKWRSVCQDLGINKSQYPFQPHITEGSLDKGAEPTVRFEHVDFLFSHAEYRR